MSESRPAARKPAKRKRAPGESAGTGAKAIAIQVREIVASLKRLGSKRNREGMARYAIPSDKAFGVSVGTIQQLAKRQGRNHELALALWETGWYEARMMCAFLDEPERVTPAQMERWCRDFDNWAICDTLCFQLFDRTPHAFAKVKEWSGRSNEFEKRSAFALLASLAGHDKIAGDEAFLRCLPLIEEAATDERNFVKKGVSWALRGTGRRSPKLHAAAVKLAQQLAASSNASARWVGKDALRDLTRPLVVKQLQKRSRVDAG
jgi:3-methyladenine DNA glycosylase AlkD